MTSLPSLPLVSADPTPASSGGCGCGGCGCGGQDAASAAASAPAVSEAAVQPDDLDVRALAHGERHERIFAAVAALQPGEAFVLANDHDPRPLRARLETLEPGQIGWEYRAQGPDVWRVEISRVAGHCC